MTLSILYRGALSSCNYGCAYCPFAKRHESDAEHAADGAQLSRFVDWCTARASPVRVFFTPWGEALTQRRYQWAMAHLSQQPHVTRVAVQTNLSASLDWLGAADVSKLGFWCTYHPEWTELPRFVAQCEELLRAGARFSVGVVGFPAHRPHAQALRAALPPSVYVWVNAVKHEVPRYTPEDLAFFERLDPLFPFNLKAHESRGRACDAGHTVISVDGEGTVRRCHFIAAPLGNLYAPGFDALLQPRACTNATCGCHIGYVHLPELGLKETFGDGLLERVPARALPAPRAPAR